ncbi:hypothetical protein PSPO01_05126 [Paraphaeosphaeria sporulosa]
MAELHPIPSLLALSEAVRNTGTELESIGGKLHTLAAALEKEATVDPPSLTPSLTSPSSTPVQHADRQVDAQGLATERTSLQSQLAAAQAALAAAEQKAKSAAAPWGVDVCVGIRASSSDSSTAFRKMGCCTGCGDAVPPSPSVGRVSGGSAVGSLTPAGEARSQLSKALSEVAERAEKAASQVRSAAASGGAGGGSKAVSVVSRKSGGSGVGAGGGSRATSSHASQK